MQYSRYTEETEPTLRRYLNNIKKLPRLTQAQEQRLIKRIKKGDQQAKNTLVEAHLRFVVYYARRRMFRGVPLLDLIEEGNLGLLHAVDKFDLKKETRFATYAGWWVQYYIDRCVMNDGRLIRAPIHVYKKYLRQLGEKNQVYEKDVQLFYNTDTVYSMTESTMSEPVFLKEEITDLLSDNPATHYERKEKEAEFLHQLQSLSFDERELLSKRYGLSGYLKMTLDDLAQDLSCSKECVRYAEKKAMRHLAEIMRQTRAF